MVKKNLEKIKTWKNTPDTWKKKKLGKIHKNSEKKNSEKLGKILLRPESKVHTSFWLKSPEKYSRQIRKILWKTRKNTPPKNGSWRQNHFFQLLWLVHCTKCLFYHYHSALGCGCCCCCCTPFPSEVVALFRRKWLLLAAVLSLLYIFSNQCVALWKNLETRHWQEMWFCKILTNQSTNLSPPFSFFPRQPGVIY